MQAISFDKLYPSFSVSDLSKVICELCLDLGFDSLHHCANIVSPFIASLLVEGSDDLHCLTRNLDHRGLITLHDFLKVY